jgi:iron complex outermembrane receptor protein
VRVAGRDGWASASTTAFRAERGVPPELDVDDPRLWRYPKTWRAVTVLAGGLDDLENGLGRLDLEASLGVDLGGTTIHDFAMPAAAPADPDAFYRTLDETEESDDLTLTLRLRGDQHLSHGVTASAAATYAQVRHDELITVGIASGSPQTFPAQYRQRLWSVGTEVDVPFQLGGLGPFTGGRFSGGLAMDGADTPETGGAVPGGGPSVAEWGGRLGLSASTSGGGLLVHTALSRKGRFPALREMYSTALGRFEPNPDLQAEILTAIEAGFTSRFGPYDLQMVGFHQRLDNAIVRGAPPAGSAARFQRVNRDLIRSTGVEVVAGYSIGRGALETEFTIQDVVVVEPGGTAMRAEYEPEFAGGIGGSAPLLAGVEAGAELKYLGRQFCSSPQPGQEDYETLSGSTRTDLQLARTFRLPGATAAFQRVGVELAVENLTDSAIYDQCGLPQPGRTLRLQVRID